MHSVVATCPAKPARHAVHLRRRQVVLGAAAACVVGSSAAEAQAVPAISSLDELARRTNRRYGFAIDPSYAQKEPARSLLAQHAGVITAENAMKWRNVENAAGIADYSVADRVADIANSLKAQLRGHTLAWHQSTPAYLANASPADFKAAQTLHLQAMAKRYKGRIDTWDVLNEVVDADAKNGSGLRDSVLSRLWGISHYPALFELVREADPKASLGYNDYGMEQDDIWCERRRTAVLRLLDSWVRQKTPLDVMGLQAHLSLSRPFSANVLLKFFDELQALGLRIQITELDVRDDLVPGDIQLRDAAVAALYRDFIGACFSHPAVEMVVMWNVTDDNSWINRWTQGQRRSDGLPMRPTLFDAQGQPKPAFAAVVDAMRNATVHFEGQARSHA